VTGDALGNSDVLLEVMLEREVKERRPQRGQLERRGAAALDDGHVGGREVLVQARHEPAQLDTVRVVAEVEAVAGTNLYDAAGEPREQVSAMVGLLGLLGSAAEAVVHPREQRMSDHDRRPLPS
jgi:hypothetical protein